MSTDPQNRPRASLEPLVHTCREISKLLGQTRPSPALRLGAPQLVEALPLVKALVLGVEDLVDRVTLIEAQQQRRAASHQEWPRE